MMRKWLLPIFFSIFLQTPCAGADSNLTIRNAPWLLGQLKAIADGGLLADDQRVSTMLALELHSTQEETVPLANVCSNPYPTTSSLVTRFQVANGWYKATPDGVAHMKFPAVAINRAGESGDPKVTYFIARMSNCPSGKLATETHAQLDFEGLPAFACLTPENLKEQLSATFHLATDGVGLSTYEGIPNDTFGTQIEFFFRMGAPCALGVTVTQDDRYGYRRQRAAVKYAACRASASRDYCATHAPVSWRDSQKLSEMNNAATQTCGDFEAFYQKEPKTGEPPPPPPPPHIGPPPDSPCDGQ